MFLYQHAIQMMIFYIIKLYFYYSVYCLFSWQFVSLNSISEAFERALEGQCVYLAVYIKYFSWLTQPLTLLENYLPSKKYTQISLTKFQLWVRHRRSLLKRQSVCGVPELNHTNGKMTGRENCAQAIGMTVTLRGLWRKVDSRTWESFTRSGLILVSVDHAQMSSGKGLQLLHFNIKPLLNSVVQRIQMRFRWKEIWNSST